MKIKFDQKNIIQAIKNCDNIIIKHRGKKHKCFYIWNDKTKLAFYYNYDFYGNIEIFQIGKMQYTNLIYDESIIKLTKKIKKELLVKYKNKINQEKLYFQEKEKKEILKKEKEYNYILLETIKRLSI